MYTFNRARQLEFLCKTLLGKRLVWPVFCFHIIKNIHDYFEDSYQEELKEVKVVATAKKKKKPCRV